MGIRAVGLSVYFIVSNVVGIFQYSAMGQTDLGRLFRRGSKSEVETSPKDDQVAKIDKPEKSKQAETKPKATKKATKAK